MLSTMKQEEKRREMNENEREMYRKWNKRDLMSDCVKFSEQRTKRWLFATSYMPTIISLSSHQWWERMRDKTDRLMKMSFSTSSSGILCVGGGTSTRKREIERSKVVVIQRYVVTFTLYVWYVLFVRSKLYTVNLKKEYDETLSDSISLSPSLFLLFTDTKKH